MSESKTCKDPRECSVCAYSESDGKKMLFLSDIYSKYPTLPVMCGCISDTGKSFCSDCFLNTLVASIAPPTPGSSTLGAQNVICTYKCPFCRDQTHSGITRPMWFEQGAITSNNLLLLVFLEALNSTPEKGKKFHLKPGPGANIFLTSGEDERILPLFTLTAQCTKTSFVFKLYSRLRFQKACCTNLCNWNDISEYSSKRVLKSVVIRVQTPRVQTLQRRSKRLNAATDERPTKVNKTS